LAASFIFNLHHATHGTEDGVTLKAAYSARPTSRNRFSNGGDIHRRDGAVLAANY
jgi:hypothetical protein